MQEKNGELWLCNCYIKTYHSSSDKFNDPMREKKLLITKKELNKLLGSVKKEGLSIIPLSIYFNDNGLVKVNIEEMDLTHLGTRHTRALFARESNWSGTWLAP